MRLLPLLIFILIPGINVFGQKISNLEVLIEPSLLQANEIPYSSVPLTWESFKASPDHSCHFIAMTYSGIKINFSYKTRNGVASAKVSLCPYMDVSQSWYKKQGKNEATLAHEQRHFDITELIARKLAAAIKSQDFESRTFSEEIKQIYARHLEELKEMQAAYDRETNHGMNARQQADWDKKILAMLRSE